MARVFYGSTTAQQHKEHDDAVLAAQLHLLELLKEEDVPSSVRAYAEAYALISGLAERPIGLSKS